MNRLDKLFEKKRSQVLSVFFTAGHPNLDDTRRILLELDAAGADLVEIGMPFSDPLADGQTIQASSHRALENGMSLDLLFRQLENMRSETELPVILMGYLNPVLQFGFENFCKKCQEIGVDGLILPDLPLWEFENFHQKTLEKYGLHLVFLVTPQTSEARIRQLDAASGGFLYAVSTASTTGKAGVFDETQEKYFQKLAEMHLKNPVLVGFGIAGAENFEIASRHLAGGIVGSAFIRALEDGVSIKTFVQNILGFQN